MKILGNTVSTTLNPKKLSTLGEKYFIYSGDNLHYGYAAAGSAPIQTKYTEFDTTDTISYRFKVTYADGFKEIIDTTFKDVVGITAADVSSKSERLANILVSPVNGDMHLMSLNGQETDYIEALEISLTSGEPIHVPIDAKLIPIDNDTLKIDENGKIVCGVKLDLTFSNEGQAPDAKLTGERFTNIEKQIADMLYEPIEIKSFTNDVNTKEIGSYVKNIAFNWSFNKTPKTVTLDGVGMLPEFTGYSKTGLNITENTTFTLEATDERDTVATKTTSITFLNGIYYGGAAMPEALNSAFVLSLTKNLRSTKHPSFTVNAYAGEYIYYCLPKRLGACSFSVGGFTGGFFLADTISFTNASGYTEEYYIYRSDSAGLGKTTVNIM